MTTRKRIQGPMLSYMLDHPEGVSAAQIVGMTGAGSSSVSGALNRLKGNGVIEKRGKVWRIKSREEAQFLTEHTYHTKNRDEAAPVVASNGQPMMGDLFELIGSLRDGSQLVRTLDTGLVYKLEEV